METNDNSVNQMCGTSFSSFTEGPLLMKQANRWCRDASVRQIPVDLWKGLWYEGELACLFSDSNSGKSIMAVQIAEEIARSGHRVVYFDFEQSDKQFQLRYTDATGRLAEFSDNLIRCEIDTSSISETVNNCDLVWLMVSAADRADAKVIIIDNLTFMCADSESGLAAHDLMVKLVEMKKAWGLSILVLAHTPKRDLATPISQNDLAGSKRLFNFFDSVWAIGRSTQGDNVRYIKQLKSRMAAIQYGEQSVLTAEIVKNGAMLEFATGTTCPECNHLKQGRTTSSENVEEILRLRNEGKSIREIADIVKISKSCVGNIVKREDI